MATRRHEECTKALLRIAAFRADLRLFKMRVMPQSRKLSRNRNYDCQQFQSHRATSSISWAGGRTRRRSWLRTAGSRRSTKSAARADYLSIARLHRRPRAHRKLDARAERVRPGGGRARHGGDGERSARDRQRAGRGRRASTCSRTRRRCRSSSTSVRRRACRRRRSKRPAPRSRSPRSKQLLDDPRILLSQRDDELPRHPVRRPGVPGEGEGGARPRQAGRWPRAGLARRGGGPLHRGRHHDRS